MKTRISKTPCIKICLRFMLLTVIATSITGCATQRELEALRLRVDALSSYEDQDNDGVPDKYDLAPNTPQGVLVNSEGRALDSDDDGFPDHEDDQPFTPRGCEVDGRGLALDTDQDGVADCLDHEPRSLPGALVDVKGITISPSSHDNVYNRVPPAMKEPIRDLRREENDDYQDRRKENMEIIQSEGSWDNAFLSPNHSQEKGFKTIHVYYGTDRSRTNKDIRAEIYGGERGKMEYGRCKVSIPNTHKIGELEAPSIWGSITKFEIKSLWTRTLQEHPEEHVVLMDVATYSKENFLKEISSDLRNTKQKEAFVFIHGYNVSFEDAARRTAQIAYDLNFDGVPMMYSWPSKAELKAYPADEATIQWTQPHLKEFLEDIALQSGAESIYLIAHSMGNRALTRAFADLAEEQGEKLSEKFKEVILTAADIDAGVFVEQIAPKMEQSGAHITIYTSSNDKALLASQTIHTEPRLGEGGNNIVTYPGFDTIDATAVNTELFGLGHSFFAESKSVISDIKNLFVYKESIDGWRRQRYLERRSKGRDFYWEFLP